MARWIKNRVNTKLHELKHKAKEWKLMHVDYNIMQPNRAKCNATMQTKSDMSSIYWMKIWQSNGIWLMPHPRVWFDLTHKNQPATKQYILFSLFPVMLQNYNVMLDVNRNKQSTQTRYKYYNTTQKHKHKHKWK